MSRQSKHHTEEFKAEAVDLVESSGKSMPEIAEELGINQRTLYTWVTKQRPKSEAEAQTLDLAAENKRLRREREKHLPE